MKSINFRRTFIFFLIIVITITSVSSSALAADTQRSSAYLDSYNAYIYDCGNGHFQIWFSVSGVNVMDQLGALNVILKESSDNGTTWNIAKTYRYTAYPSMLGTNRMSYLSCVEFTGTVGYKYYANVSIWAGRNGGGDSRQITTPIVRLTQAGQG